ncbi:MAG: hypothetical protein ACOH16_03410 [Propionibacteriaceae bacterium]
MRRRDLFLGAGPLVLLVGCSQPDNRPAIIVGNAAPGTSVGDLGTDFKTLARS